MERGKIRNRNRKGVRLGIYEQKKDMIKNEIGIGIILGMEIVIRLGIRKGIRK